MRLGEEGRKGWMKSEMHALALIDPKSFFVLCPTVDP